MGYKFSWSPLGALVALKNSARFLKDGEITEIPAEKLLYTAHDVDINMALKLEGYKNRDSIGYIEKYGI